MEKRRDSILIKELSDPPQQIDLIESFRDLPYRFFLDSASGREKLGNFSFLGCEPFLVFKSKRDSVTLEWADGKAERIKANPISVLRDLLKRYELSKIQNGLPLESGVVGYFAYDLKDFIEELPDDCADDICLPDIILGFYDTVIIYDNILNKAYIASSGLPYAAGPGRQRRAEERLKIFLKRLASVRPNSRPSFRIGALSGMGLESNYLKSSYMAAVDEIKGYIKKGDIYQANLSQRFHTKLNTDPFDLYRRLRNISPAPFSSYLDLKDVVIASSSPERFLMKRGGYIETRPIKGTRPRGSDEMSDIALENELANSQKDRAEHIMIMDLERNDLGRICEYGTVRPTESLAIERYSNVFHLVSTVSGRLRKGVGPIDCLMATFPGGSITGAPKIRAMEIIEEMEGAKRSVYTGAIGYISFCGDMDTSIAIRTFLIKGRDVFFHVGGGIVADSDPEAEYEETLDKAKGLIAALGMDRSGVGVSRLRAGAKEVAQHA